MGIWCRIVVIRGSRADKEIFEFGIWYFYRKRAESAVTAGRPNDRGEGAKRSTNSALGQLLQRIARAAVVWLARCQGGLEGVICVFALVNNVKSAPFTLRRTRISGPFSCDNHHNTIGRSVSHQKA